MSKEWRIARELIISAFDGIDIYAYYINHEIEQGNRVHHIIELEEDWEKRLDLTNLIPLSQKNHGIVTALYNESAATKQQTQRLLRSLVDRHFESRGGLLKVLGLLS